MVEVIQSVLDSAGEHVALLLACVLVFALVDSALGLGAVLPGETAVVFAAVALSDSPAHVAAAVVAAAVGAFLGDHIGFGAGRLYGDRLGQTTLVRHLGGPERWNEARSFVARRFWLVIVARLLPGVRTLVAAAAGASTMSYARFASASAIAAVMWSMIWVVGGALLGNALLLLVERSTAPVLGLAAAGIVVAVLLARRRRRRNA